jgi:integrase/recombinase XerD
MVGKTTLEALQKAYQNLSGPVLLSNRGTRLTGMGLRSVFSTLSKRSGIKVTPHALRRSFATISIRNGMGILQVQGLLGHATLEMTKRYARLVQEDLEDAHRVYGPVDNFKQ